MDNVVLSVAEATRQLLEKVTPVGSIQKQIREALDHVLAQPVYALSDLPTYTNSSMDGYAVKASNTVEASRSNSIKLDIVMDVPAGSVPQQVLKLGQAARVMTGAPIPNGADAVVPVESTNRSFLSPEMEGEKTVEIYTPVKVGDYIRKQGGDVKKDELVITPGRRLRPQDLGLLAMLGIDQVTVYRKPRIAVLSTGDELIPLGAKPEPGKIFDSNSYSLGGLIRQNHCDLIELKLVGDRIQSVKEQLDLAVNQNADFIITSAGVSVGAYDYVREVIQKFGSLEFWRINMRPGKPLAFGEYRHTPIVGLPGNPVSAFVGFEVVVRPAVLKLCGLKYFFRTSHKVKITEPIVSDGRESYLRAWVWRENGQLYAKLISHQGSGNLHSLILANAFLIIPSEVKSLPVDEELNAWIFDDQLMDI